MNRKYSALKGFLIYLIFWIILSEKIDFQVILVGIFVTLGIGLYGFQNKEGCYAGKCFPDFVRYKLYVLYIILLIKEIVIASVQLARIVLSRELNISPVIIKFKTKLKEDLSKTILANSITLTPGTLTIEVKENEFTVHCIQKSQIEDVMNSKFEELLLKIEEQ